MMQLPVARILAVAVSLCLLLYLTNISRGKWIDRVFRSSWTSAKFRNENTSPVEEWRQAINFPIVGLVFYGRREYVSILECYLQRNLRKNGGLLNEVIFLVRTEVAEDLGWLEQILQITPEYSKHTVATGRHGSYADAWDLVENGTLYIKIDDDVVFFEDHTIDAMVKRKLEHPEYFLIAANTINQPAQSWVHYHLGVAHPYLPELTPPPDFTTRSSYNAVSYHYQDKPTWRPSQLPSWIGPTDLKFDETYPAPFPGHRWLPLSPDADITTTPISIVDYTAAGPGWHSWAVGAQAHYSFLQNLENDQLHRYKYDIWDYEYDRISINLVLISGEDVRSVMPLEDDDELYLTMKAPRRLGRHAIMEGRGLAVHYGFGAQVMAHGWHGLRDTDVLDRYRAFARERVCGVPRGRRLAGP